MIKIIFLQKQSKQIIIQKSNYIIQKYNKYFSITQTEEQKIQMNAHHKCQICHKQTSDCLITDIANYSTQTGNLTMIPRVVCHCCREEVTTIRQFVQENQLSFGKNSAIYHQTVQKFIHLERQKQKERGYRKNGQSSQIYQKSIQLQIKRNKLYHCAKLPQNCLQLVYYSSLTINHAQRHQRIKNTIGQAMKIVPIPYMNLEDVAILVHCLSCFMHQDNVIRLLKIICIRQILEGIPVKQKDVIQEKEELGDNIGGGVLWRQLYRKCYIGNILLIIEQLLTNWKCFEINFQKLRQYHGYIKKQQLPKILGPNEISSPLRKHNSQQYRQFETNCKQCANFRIQSLLNQARVKNLLALTLKSLIKQDAAYRQHVAQLEQKFVKQKQQFINKIIKLKDKIEILEHHETNQNDQPDIIMRRARSVSDCYARKKFKSQLQSVSEKSQGTIKTIQFRQKNQDSIPAKMTFQTDKSKQNQYNNQGNSNGHINGVHYNNVTLEDLQRLATIIPEFDPSMLSPQAEPKSLLDTIQNSLKKMRQQLQKLQKKTKLLQNQSKRLLTILTRKQQRFVPLIHQKDEIIQKYQNALWKMQHGLIVEDPALATRIANIINVFRNDFMDSLSNGTLQSDINYQQITKQSQPSTPSKTKTSSKKKNKQKQRGSQKTQNKVKSSEKDKQCLIF